MSETSEEFDPEWESGRVLDVSALRGHLPCVGRVEGLGEGEEEGGEVTQALGPLLLLAVWSGTKAEGASLLPHHSPASEDEAPRLVIPLNYTGWWQRSPQAEVEEEVAPRSPRHLSTIQETALARPKALLLGTPIPAFCLCEGSSPGSRLYTQVTLPAGQVLSVQGPCLERVRLPPKKRSRNILNCMRPLKVKCKGKRHMYLKCEDDAGRELLLSYQEKGEFYSVSDQLDESDAADTLYQIKDLAVEDNLPLTLTLVKGEPPSLDESNFSGMVQLDQVYTEEAILACTIVQDKPTLVEFPLDSEIQFLIADNWTSLKSTTEIHTALQYYTDFAEAYSRTIKILQNVSHQSQVEEVDMASHSSKDNKLKPKGSFIMRNRELPPLPERRLSKKKSKWETLRERKNSLFTQLSKTLSLGTLPAKVEAVSADPDYERIPFYSSQSVGCTLHVQSEAVCETASTVSSCKDSVTPELPRKSVGMFQRDEDGYLLPSEARQQLEAYREQLRSTELTSEEAGVNEPIYNNQAVCHLQDPSCDINEFDTCMDAIVFGSRVPEGTVPTFDSQRLDSFLADTMQELERKLGPHPQPLTSEPRIPANTYDNLQTEEDVEDFLEKIFGACDVTSDEENEDNDRVNTLVTSTPAAHHPVVHRSVSLDMCHHQDNNLMESRSEPSGYAQAPPDLHFSALHTDSGIWLGAPYPDQDVESLHIHRSFSDCSWSPPEDITGLSVEEVGLSLRYIGMRPTVVARFCQEQIDGKMLSDLTDSLLKEAFPELNVLDRKKILDFIQGWRPKRWVY